MGQQNGYQTFANSSLETVQALPSLEEPPDNPALATDTATTYHTLPLIHSKSTRVLRIVPSKSDQSNTIFCELQLISLDDDPPPEYCALSYVWGSPSETRRIMVNNEPFFVRKNLWDFLSLMRRQKFSGLLWIDAICINQGCIHERNHQVSVMSSIYRGATRVIAWLGAESAFVPCDGETLNRPGMDTLRLDCYLQIPLFDCIRLMVDKLSLFPPDCCHDTLDNGFLLFQKMKELHYAEYWTRIWIVQEYTLARDITLMTDRSQMEGKEFLEAFNDHRYKMVDEDYIVEFDASPMMKVMESYGNGSLKELISRHHESKCIDPRDHVYALLSLADPKEIEYYGIHPDYSKSELLLFTELVYKAIKQRDWHISRRSNPLLFAKALGIDTRFAVKLVEKITAKVKLDCKSGRQISAEELAEELTQLAS